MQLNDVKLFQFFEMSENTKFDLKHFQSEVLRHYNSLKREADDAALFAEKGYAGFEKNSDAGFIKRIFNKFLIFLKMKFYNFYIKSEPFVELERKAVEIIENPKIKKILCPIFKRKISADFFREELEIEIMIIVTVSLTKRKAVEQFSIDKDERFFAMMTHKILQKGIERYCID